MIPFLKWHKVELFACLTCSLFYGTCYICPLIFQTGWSSRLGYVKGKLITCQIMHDSSNMCAGMWMGISQPNNFKDFSALGHGKKECDLRDPGSLHKAHSSCTTENWPCAAYAYLPCCNHVKYYCFCMEMEMQFTEQCSNYHHKNIC